MEGAIVLDAKGNLLAAGQEDEPPRVWIALKIRSSGGLVDEIANVKNEIDVQFERHPGEGPIITVRKILAA